MLTKLFLLSIYNIDMLFILFIYFSTTHQIFLYPQEVNVTIKGGNYMNIVPGIGFIKKYAGGRGRGGWAGDGAVISNTLVQSRL